MSFFYPSDKSSYDEQVWNLVRQIPHGQIATYGQIAKLVPQPDDVSFEDYRAFSARWVGMALSSSPKDVPWQRVINSQGRISHNIEPGKQKRLLEEEGVIFLTDKVRLRDYQWSGPEASDQPQQGSLF